MKMNQDRDAELPIRSDLTLTYTLTLVIIILMTATSIAGLVSGNVFYATQELRSTFVANDAANLLIGLPLLLGSMWLARHGKLIGLLCWPGALFVVLYTYLIYSIALILARLSLFTLLPYLSLVAISVYALFGLITGIDGKLVQKSLTGAVPERIGAGVLAGFGLLFFLRALGGIVNVLSHATPMPATGLAVDITDLLITPFWVVGGIQLWRRKTWGYVAGFGLLFQACSLFIALIFVMLLQLFLNSAPISVGDVGAIAVMGLICFIPFVLFVRGVMAK